MCSTFLIDKLVHIKMKVFIFLLYKKASGLKLEYQFKQPLYDLNAENLCSEIHV